MRRRPVAVPRRHRAGPRVKVMRPCGPARAFEDDDERERDDVLEIAGGGPPKGEGETQ